MRISLHTVGTRGDLLPFARLAQALLGRGHEVLVHSLGYAAESFSATGATFVTAGGGHTQTGWEQALADALRQRQPLPMIGRVVRYLYVEGAAEFLASAARVIASSDLSIINVGDHLSQAAAMIAARPWVLWAARPPAQGAAQAREDALLSPIDVDLSRYVSMLAGRKVELRLFRTHSPWLNLCACSPALVPSLSELPAWRLTGAFLAAAAPTPNAELSRFAAAGEPPLLVTFGSLPEHEGQRTAAVLAALQETGRRAIILGQGPQVANVLWAEPALFGAALHCVDGVLHHGGVGTSHEVCRAGLPQATVPHLGDQYFWGHRLCELGLAAPPVPHVQPSPERLVASLRALRQPELQRRAQELAPALANEDGVAVAVRAIEALAGARPA